MSEGDTAEHDPFEGVVLDEDFIRGGAYEAPARTRDAIAKHKDTGWRGNAPLAGPPTGPPHEDHHRLRRRPRGPVVLTVAFVVLVGGLLTFAFTRPSSDHPTTAATNPSSATGGSGSYTGLVGADFHQGGCYTWKQGQDSSVVSTVPCSQAHLFEAVSAATVHGFPDDRVYPTDAQWKAITGSACGASVDSWLGYTPTALDHWEIAQISPTPMGWAAGDRAIECGVDSQQVGALADETSAYSIITPFVGDAHGTSRWYAPAVGSCTRDATVHGVASYGSVPCTDPHDTEYVGSITIAAAAYPSSQQQGDLVFDRCQAVADAYAGEHVPGSAGQQVGGWIIDATSWAAGDRTVACEVFDPRTPPVLRSGSVRTAGRVAA